MKKRRNIKNFQSCWNQKKGWKFHQHGKGFPRKDWPKRFTFFSIKWGKKVTKKCPKSLVVNFLQSDDGFLSISWNLFPNIMFFNFSSLKSNNTKWLWLRFCHWLILLTRSESKKWIKERRSKMVSQWILIMSIKQIMMRVMMIFIQDDIYKARSSKVQYVWKKILKREDLNINRLHLL